MKILRAWQSLLATAAFLLALGQPLIAGDAPVWLFGLGQPAYLIAIMLAVAVLVSYDRRRSPVGDLLLFVGAHLAGGLTLYLLPQAETAPAAPSETVPGHMLADILAAPGFWALALLAWLLAWRLVTRLSLSVPRQPFGQRRDLGPAQDIILVDSGKVARQVTQRDEHREPGLGGEIHHRATRRGIARTMQGRPRPIERDERRGGKPPQPHQHGARRAASSAIIASP